MDQFVAADTHGATTTFAVRSGSGKVTDRRTVDTNGRKIVAFLRGLRGSVYLTFEEGPMAQWMFETTRPHVKEVIVCDPRQNKLLGAGSKSDDIDAEKLSELLRLGALTSVYHEAKGSRLKELTQGYLMLVKAGVQEKNQLKALFRSRAIGVAGTGVYRAKEREEWLAKLEGARRERAGWTYELIDTTQRLKEEAVDAMTEEAKLYPEWKLLRTVPGIGPIRAAIIRAYVGTPHRFRTKRQFWGYVGLGVVTRSSSDYIRTKNGYRKRTPHARGLNPNHRPELKTVFKSAALESVQRRGPFHERYRQMVDSGIAPEMAVLTIARKLAAIALTIWKTGEVYDPKKALPQAVAP